MIPDDDPNYFDYAATSPPWPEALTEFVQVSHEFFGNPSSIHAAGRKAREKVYHLKKQFCDQLQFPDGRLLLCASASEANTTIIEGHLSKITNARLLIVEDVHDSIWYAVNKHPKSIKIQGIQSDGVIDQKKFTKAIEDGISMVCMSHVCHETGAIHPVSQLADLCFRRQVRVLIDGVQAIGHLPVNLGEIPFTYYSFSTHKFGAPKGTGGAFIRDDAFEPRIHGGKHQWNLRAGTEDTAGLAATVAAIKKNREFLFDLGRHHLACRQHLIGLLSRSQKIRINSPDHGLPGILSLSIKGNSGYELVNVLSAGGFAVSTGAACQTNQMEPSRILIAMGRSLKEATGCLRISFGRSNTLESVGQLAQVILDAIN